MPVLPGLALGITVEHFVPYVHTQNGLAESLIKRIKLIARPLLQNCNLPTSCWGHAVLHAAELIQIPDSPIKFVVELKRKLDDVYDVDAHEGLSTTKPKCVKSLNEDGNVLLIPKVEK